MANIVLSITQGEKYRLVLRVPGDYSTWLPRGQVRSTAGASSILAVWDFEANSYDIDNNRTIIRAYLGATKTALIPVPPQGNVGGRTPGVHIWQTDIEMQNPGDEDDVLKVLPISGVRVRPEVTR